MKILLTGVTGYIAQRLLPVLLDNGHEVKCCVRDSKRFMLELKFNRIAFFCQLDLLNGEIALVDYGKLNSSRNELLLFFSNEEKFYKCFIFLIFKASFAIESVVNTI
jgi:nucleoside-diphosphate-sugar epimerase